MVSAIAAPAPGGPLRSAAITAVSAPAMPEHRLAAFRSSVAARLRQGVPIATQLREQEALTIALADPSFEHHMAAAFMVEMRAQEPNPDYAISPVAAQRQVHGILANRIRDCHGFIASLKDEAFLASVAALAAQPPAAPKEYDLPAAKKEEVIRRLVQPQDPAGAEPEVHVAAAALGHRAVHMALANIFRPKAGPLRAPLVDALARAWPEGTGKALEELATGWLKARHDPAHSIADGLKENGELYRGAIRLMEKSRPPVPQIGVPATAPTRLQAASADLTVGGL